MKLNPKKIKCGFEKSLDSYYDNAIVQRDMAENLVSAILSFGNNYGHVLELGAGAGILTELLSKSVSYDKYCTNDLTEKSEKYVRKYLKETVFYSGNALKIKPDIKFDLVVSNAMFQWLDLDEMKNKAKLLLNNAGMLAFSTFAPDNYKEVRDLTGLTLDYRTFDEVKKIFSDEYDILFTKEYKKVLEFKTPLELLAHMKNTGVNSLNRTCWTFKDVKDFCEAFSKKYERVHLTYSPMIFVMKLKF